MTLKVFLRILALFDALALGAVWLSSPTTGLDPQPGPHAMLVARALGTDLLVIAIMNWLVSSQSGELMRRFLWPNLLMHTVPAVISLVYIADGSFGPQAWTGVALHGIAAVSVAVLIVISRTGAEGRTGPGVLSTRSS